MPTLTIYDQKNFPSVYNWQAIAFMRCEWASIFQGDILYLSDPYPPDMEPVHFVMAEGDSLLSYASVFKRTVSHAGQDYSIYGFGNMFTFKPYRKNGYGRKILHAATEFIQQSDVDAGALFCDKSLDRYYGAEGWVTTKSPTHVSYTDEPYEPLRMMLFVSEIGRANRKAFDELPLHIDYPW